VNGLTSQPLAVQRPVQVDCVLLDTELEEMEFRDKWDQTRMLLTWRSWSVGLNKTKPNTRTLAITDVLISSSPGPIRRNHSPINIAVPRCAALLGFT
jgi:hypothetical protein